MNSQTDRLPPALRIRKVRGEPGLNARHYADHQDGEPSLHPWGGVTFIDESKRNVDVPMDVFQVPHDFVEREHWIEPENPRVEVFPAGPADAPYSKTHSCPQADALLLHMAPGVTLRYRVVHNPGKYDNETGEPAKRAGDPTTHVDWFYVCEYDGEAS
jgi:hypothetical protein